MPAEFSLLDEPLLSAYAVDRAAHLRGDAEALEVGWPTSLVMRVDARGRFRTEVAETPGDTVGTPNYSDKHTPGGAGDSAGSVGATGSDLGGRHLRLTFEPAFDIAERPPHLAVFLGRAEDGRHVWALQTDSLGTQGVADLRSCGEFLLPQDAALAAEAVALLGWHRHNNAGKTPDAHLTRANSGWSGRDPVAEVEIFPRTDPAIICLVHDGERRVLLARNSAWTENFYSVLAGFVEAGESLENCVRREIAEEVGLDVRNPRYLGSQPWPFPRSLMLAFQAVANPDQEIVRGDGEIDDARWLDVRDVERILAGEDMGIVLPGRVSIARLMLESWVAAVVAEIGEREGRAQRGADVDVAGEE